MKMLSHCAAPLVLCLTFAPLPARSASLIWNGTSSNAKWDLGTSIDWLNGPVSSSYSDGDAVTFNDSAAYYSPNLVSIVQPGSVVVSATTNYTLSGTGSIAGTTALTKSGIGTLNITSSNSFSGGVTINGGIVQMGHVCALGATNSVVSVNGGTLELHSIHPTNWYFSIQGSGFTNGGAIQMFTTTALQNGNGLNSLTLTGDATIGASGARWDLWGFDAPGSTGLQGNGYTLTKMGTADIWLNDAGTNTGLGDIKIVQGKLGLQGQAGGVGTGLGDPAKTLTVYDGAAFATYRQPANLVMDKNIVLSNAFYLNSQGDATFVGPITLYGTNTQINGYAESAAHQVNFNGPINGPGSLNKTNVGVDVFNATNTYTGATLVTGGRLVIGTTSSLTNSPFVQVGAGATLDVTANGLSLESGQTLAGAGAGATVSGAVTAGPGSTVTAGIIRPGLLTVDQLTLSGATNVVALGDTAADQSGNVSDMITVNGNLTLSGLNVIQVVPIAVLDTTTPYTFAQYNGTLSGGLANLSIVGANPHYTYSLLNPATTAPFLKLQVGGASQPLLWKGGTASAPNTWNLGATNWWNTVTAKPDRFYPGDVVWFDDSATTATVNIAESVTPVSTIFKNAGLSYTVTGTPTLSGVWDQEGSGSVVMSMNGIPPLTSIQLNAGTLILNPQVTKSYSLPAQIADNGSGQGTLIKADTNILVLSGNNLNYSGTLVVTNGILQYASSSALGQAFATLYVTNNGTLDFLDRNAGLKNIAIAGSGYNGLGALYDSSVNTASHVVAANVTLLGDATIGALGRWDLPSTGASPNGGAFNGNGFSLTKVGGGQIWIAPAGGIGVGNIRIAAGTLGFSPHVTDLGIPTNTITIERSASLYFWGNPNMLDKVIVMNGPATISSGASANEAATNNLVGPITLNGTNTFNATSSGLAFWNSITGPGGFIKAGAANLLLLGTNNYSGPTILNANAGTVFVGPDSSLGFSSLIQIGSGAKLDVSAPGALRLGTNQVLVGTGTLVGGTINFNYGSTLAAGGLVSPAAATLTAKGALVFQPGSTNFVAVNKTTTIANSKVTGLGAITFGGTLVITNLGNALAVGDAIPFASATNYSGAFNNIVPATPGPGLAWDTSTIATDGTLRVIQGTTPPPANLVYSISGNQITLSWPADRLGSTLQAQTNAASVGINTNWSTVSGSTATNQVIIPIDPANGSVFYRLLFTF